MINGFLIPVALNVIILSPMPDHYNSIIKGNDKTPGYQDIQIVIPAIYKFCYLFRRSNKTVIISPHSQMKI